MDEVLVTEAEGRPIDGAEHHTGAHGRAASEKRRVVAVEIGFGFGQCTDEIPVPDVVTREIERLERNRWLRHFLLLRTRGELADVLGRECSHSSAVRTSSPLLECHKTGPDTPTRGAVILASRSAGRRFCLGSTHRAASCGEASRRADRPSTVLAMGRRWPLIGRIDELRSSPPPHVRATGRAAS